MSDSDPQYYDIVIVGAGHGGSQAAIQLRQAGFAGSIALIGEEVEPPYERPPLSKDYLIGDKTFERMLVRPLAFWAERGIVLIADTRVTAIDAPARQVTTSAGDAIGYGQLIWAAGGSARGLPCSGGINDGVLAIRRRRDVDAIHAALPGVGHVLIVGGGYIGLEAAAAMRTLGKSVTLIEMADRLLARVAGPALSRFYADEHRRQGVDVRLGASIERLVRSGTRIIATLADGDTVACDLVIVGIGIVPEIGPLIAAGAAGGDGIDVDTACRTSLPDIYAIGDCASHGNVWADGEYIRIESVQNAHDMAKVVAADIVGGGGNGTHYDALPWFWSNQYDLKLQTVGLSTDADSEVVRGEPASRSFSVVYLRGDRVIAVDAVNRAKDYVQGRKLIEARAQIDPAALADIDVPLKDLLPG